MEKNNSVNRFKRWVIALIITVLALLTLFGGVTVFVDPFFHFHRPVSFLSYKMDLEMERYINDGIARNFDYDAVISGSSMTECFRTSVCDELLGTTAVKLPHSGGTWAEINNTIRTAVSNNPEVKLVIRGLDPIRFFDEPDSIDYESELYPSYLYDNNPFNDVKYIFNKEVFVKYTWDVFGKTRTHKPTETFDGYANWSGYYPYGFDAIMAAYYDRDSVESVSEVHGISDEEYATMRESVAVNITDLADEYPDVTFCYFISPYSILYWDYMTLLGDRERMIDAEQFIASLVLEHDNIHLFSFSNEYDFICNLDLYKDTHHYGQEGSDRILQMIASDTGRLTKDNYLDFYEKMRGFYSTYDYEALFER